MTMSKNNNVNPGEYKVAGRERRVKTSFRTGKGRRIGSIAS